jgi:hypothetical protein
MARNSNQYGKTRNVIAIANPMRIFMGIGTKGRESHKANNPSLFGRITAAKNAPKQINKPIQAANPFSFLIKRDRSIIDGIKIRKPNRKTEIMILEIDSKLASALMIIDMIPENPLYVR